MSLAERTRTGLREMPSNAAWLLSRALSRWSRRATAALATSGGGRARPWSTPLRRRGLGRDPDAARARGRGAGSRGRGARRRGRAGGQGALRPRPPGERAWTRPHGGGGPRDEPAASSSGSPRPRRPPTSWWSASARPPRRMPKRSSRRSTPRSTRRSRRRRKTPRRPRSEPRSSSRTPPRSSRRPGGWREEGAEAARAAAEEAQRQAQQLADEAEQQAERRRGPGRGRREDPRAPEGDGEGHRARARPGGQQRRSGVLQQAGAGRARGRHRHRGTDDHDQGRARRRDREGVSHQAVKGGHAMRPLSRKSRLQRLRKTVSDSLEMPSGIKSACRESARARLLKTGLIAAGGLAALTAGERRHLFAQAPEGGGDATRRDRHAPIAPSAARPVIEPGALPTACSSRRRSWRGCWASAC